MTIAAHPNDTGSLPAIVGGFDLDRRGATETDPVLTGPMPAVVLAGGHLTVHEHNDATVVAIDGGLDAELTEEISSAFVDVLDTASCLVIDLDNATLLNPTGVDALLELVATDGRASVCLVAGRMSSRLVLDRWGIAHRVAIFGSIADALQARTFSECGYGSGWTPNR